MWDLFHESIWVVPLSVFVGGLVGSPHCASMCGPLVLNFARDRRSLVAHQCGRMLTYVGAGALLARFGSSVLGPTRPFWLVGGALIVLSALLFFSGYRALLGRPLHLPLPKKASATASSALSRLSRSHLPAWVIAAAAGSLTVFLPCGHLYTFLLGAAAAGSAATGAVLMFAFWLGSTPLLVFGTASLQGLIRSRLPSRQRIAGSLLFIAGLFSFGSFALRAETFLAERQDRGTAAAPPRELGAHLRCH